MCVAHVPSSGHREAQPHVQFFRNSAAIEFYPFGGIVLGDLDLQVCIGPLTQFLQRDVDAGNGGRLRPDIPS